ncbi:MAG: YjjG family noncanonical pyrimidine nucleotidase [Blautia sp.]|nr:YjjG family noncanonical pyrimidine nucleotidase [Blautia sp.]
MIETVFFDLDNTLLDFSKAERIAVTRTLEEFHIELSEYVLRRYSELNNAQWKLLEQGKLTRDQVKVRRFQLLFDELGISRPPQEAARRYETLLACGHYFVDGAENLLVSLYGRYRMFLVTNGTLSVQKGRLESAGIGKYFDKIFISEETGYNKPERKYFEYCFSRIPDFHKNSAVIIGDSLTSDIQGGINAGIRTIWFDPARIRAEEITPDYEVYSLGEIPDLLEKL